MIKKKGFTLVELLATIIIIGLLTAIGVFFLGNIVESSNKKADMIIRSNIIEAARVYTNEKLESIAWRQDDNKEITCVTVRTLIEKGLLKDKDNEKLWKYSSENAVEVTNEFTGGKRTEVYNYTIIDKDSCIVYNNSIIASIEKQGVTLKTITAKATCSDTSKTIVKYEFSLDKIHWYNSSALNKTYTFTGLTSGTEYLASVRCTNSDGQTKIESVSIVTDGFDRPMFEVNPPGVIAKSKTVTVLFPKKTGLTCRYKKLTDVSWTSAVCNDIPVLFKEPDIIIAEATDGVTTLSNSLYVGWIKKDGPKVTGVVTNANVWTNTNKEITATSVDTNNAGIKDYCIVTSDVGAESCTWKASTNFTYKFTGTNAKDLGEYHLYVRDKALDISDPYLISVEKIDKIIPTITYNPTGNATAYETHGTNVNVTDLESGIGALYYAWSTSNTSTPSFSNTFSNGEYLSTGGNGNMYLWIKAYDNAGNSTVTKSNAFNLKPVTYTITYNGNGNTSGSTAAQTCTSGQSVTLRANGFAKTGYEFNGWNYSSPITCNNNITVYANWILAKYTVRYNANGGYGSMTDTTCDRNTNCYLRSNSFSHSTLKFLGWSTLSTAISATYVDGGSVYNLMSSGNTVNLYAVWGSPISKATASVTPPNKYGWYSNENKTTQTTSSTSPVMQYSHPKSSCKYTFFQYYKSAATVTLTRGAGGTKIKYLYTVSPKTESEFDNHTGAITVAYSSTSITLNGSGGEATSVYLYYKTIDDNGNSSSLGVVGPLKVDYTAPTATFDFSTITAYTESGKVKGYKVKSGRMKNTCTDSLSGISAIMTIPYHGKDYYPGRDGGYDNGFYEGAGWEDATYSFIYECANARNDRTIFCVDMAGNVGTKVDDYKVYRSLNGSWVANEPDNSNCSSANC